MTSDTDEGNDPIKIEISEGSKYKQFFEKGLGALLSDPNFLLLYVPENGAKMQVIRPASDSYHRRRMIRRINEAEDIPSFYYALSHLWGTTENERYHWNDINEYVDGEDGQPVKPVSMRPEKRDTLLALLKDEPDSYWWIDVLCSRTDTPLDIMGNIYACCLECVALIDCEPGLISQINLMDDYDMSHFEQHCSNDVEAAKQCYDQCCQFIDSMHILIQSRWWRRVWTWQEMVLPLGEVHLMAETGTHEPSSNTITVDDLTRRFNYISYFTRSIEDRYEDNEEFERKEAAIRLRYVGVETLESWYTDTRMARLYGKERIQFESVENFATLLVSTMTHSPRRCMDPVDYVYGVLGLFQIEIPRMDDPVAVWKLFLSEMDKLLSHETSLRISYRAYEVDLRKVPDTSFVYRHLVAYQ